MVLCPSQPSTTLMTIVPPETDLVMTGGGLTPFCP